MFTAYIEFLIAQFAKPLPGETAQQLMSPVGRKPLAHYLNTAVDYRLGSVLAHIYPINNTPHLLLIKRTDDGKTHGGQIAFPGGKKDESDADLEQTALREAFEEVGLKPNELKIIGQLSPLYIPVSKFMVQPFTSYSNKIPELVLSADEVQNTLAINILELSQPEIIKAKRIKTFDGIIKDAPCYVINDETIWGATAMMLSELLFMSKPFFEK